MNSALAHELSSDHIYWRRVNQLIDEWQIPDSLRYDENINGVAENYLRSGLTGVIPFAIWLMVRHPQ